MARSEKTGNYITPEGRLSFPVLDKPRPIGKNPKPDAPAKYQATLLFDKQAQKSQDFKDLKQAFEDAIEEKWGKNRPRKIKSPFLTVEDLRNKVPDGYEDDHVFIRLNSEEPVGTVLLNPDGTITKVSDPREIKREFYAGCRVKAAISVYAWSHDEGGSGVSFGLANVMKVDDDEPFSSARNPDAGDDFGAPVSGGDADDDFLG